ncbi:MAG: hypothetical protein QMD10_10655 [Desulfitobacteriaceae bacterium]|nr:hypothetical protein [Desulfitobacteriaceae bacterium]
MFFQKRNDIGKPKRVPWSVILVVFVGLAVAAGSWWYLQQYIATHQKTETIVVPAYDIPAYKVIEQADLANRTILLGAREPNAVLNPGEIVGKMASTTLYKGEQIRRERLSDPVTLDRPEVTVNIDPVRVNGVLPGDIVDVYWVQSESIPGALLAVDARVISISNAEGVPLQRPQGQLAQLGQQIQQPGQQGGPAMVKLSVKPEEVPQVVRGAIGKNIVLVRKKKETGGVAPQVQAVQPPLQEEQKQQGVQGRTKS